MRPYAEVIGTPIAHSRSPLLHRLWLEALSFDGDFRAVELGAAGLKTYFDERRRDPAWRGCNITAPLKEQALLFPDQLTARAREVGAVNLIYPEGDRLIGDNSDIDGIAAALPADMVRGRSAIVIGAGGAARVAVRHLALSGAATIHILARTPRRAIGMAAHYSGNSAILLWELGARAISGASVLINASPLGMSHVPMPSDLIGLTARLGRGGLVLDMVYEPQQTALLASAKARGLHIANGFSMLVGQGRRAFEQFFGATPPVALDPLFEARLRQFQSIPEIA